MNKHLYRNALASLILASLFFTIGWYSHRWYSGDAHSRTRRAAMEGYRFTSPLLDVELPEGMTVGNEPMPFKSRIDSLVQKMIERGLAQEISVYYRDLHDGPWFGINEDAIFNPASMMKVPVMVAWLKRAEKDPRVLDHTYVYSGAEDMSALQGILPQHTITRGKRYAVDELLHFMMNYSDNNATSLLYSNMNAAELNKVLDSMDVDNRIESGENAISVHGYSGFFRILYNASFLNREMSERALELLSHQDFPEGIAAGAPSGTIVAAKFGEYAQGDKKQLHEFGIVYHRYHPYILGIMTRGTDFMKLKEVLATVSREVYRAVDEEGDRSPR